MTNRSVLIIVGLLVLTGCAAYTPPPLTTVHPAHPEATASPEPPRSTTLAYGPADLPTPQPISVVAQQGMQHGAQHGAQQGMQHGMQQGMQHGMQQGMQHGAQHTVVGEGTVIAVVPTSQQLVVDHGAIAGFMDAMTMGYRVQSPSLLEGVQAGDRIRFTIDTQAKAIVEIEAAQ